MACGILSRMVMSSYIKASGEKSDIVLLGEFSIQAKNDPQNRPKINLVAYTGEPLRLPNHDYPVVIDMAGATFSRTRTVIVTDHEYGIDKSIRVGYTTFQDVGDDIVAEGIVISTNPIIKQMVEDAKAGVPFQVSVGAAMDPGHRYFVREGETVKVNNRTYSGPLIVSGKTSIRELSIVLLGADDQTSVRIAAIYKERGMKFREWVESLGHNPDSISAELTETLKAEWDTKQSDIKAKADAELAIKAAQDEAAKAKADLIKAKADGKPGTPGSPDDIKAKAALVEKERLDTQRKNDAAEASRVDTIKATFVQFSDVEKVTHDEKDMTVSELKATAIEKGWSPQDVELLLMRASRNLAPTGVAIHSSSNVPLDIRGEVAACSILASRGMPEEAEGPHGKPMGLSGFYSERVINAAMERGNRGMSLHRLIDGVIQAAGQHFSGDRKSDDYIRAFFAAENMVKAAGSGISTMGATNVLENVANKNLLASYNAQNTFWQNVCAVKNLNDLKQHSYYRLTVEGGYREIAPDQQIPHGKMSDQKFTIDPTTKAMGLGLSRTDIINDDLDAFMQIPAGLGRLAAQALDMDVAKTLLAWDLAAAGRGILTALGIEGLREADQAFMDGVDADGKPILVGPDRILVGTQDKFLANELFRADTFIATGVGAAADRSVAKNLFAGSFTPHPTPMLNNTAIRDMRGMAIPNQDSDRWYMFANPAAMAALHVGFLRGQQVPVIESGQLDFDRLGMQWRSFHDWGVGLGDPVGVIFSAGTA